MCNKSLAEDSGASERRLGRPWWRSSIAQVTQYSSAGITKHLCVIAYSFKSIKANFIAAARMVFSVMSRPHLLSVWSPTNQTRRRCQVASFLACCTAWQDAGIMFEGMAAADSRKGTLRINSHLGADVASLAVSFAYSCLFTNLRVVGAFVLPA